MKKFLKDKFNIVWICGIVIILVGLVLGLKVNKMVGLVLAVIGMLIPTLLLIFEKKIKSDK